MVQLMAPYWYKLGLMIIIFKLAENAESDIYGFG